MAESTSIIAELGNSQFWSERLAEAGLWFDNTLASQETLIELGLIAGAAAIAWLLAKFFRTQITAFGQRDSRYALLRRLWLSLSKIAFPILWLSLQWLIELAMAKLGLRIGLIVVTSSLLTAWIVISVVTVFVANPLASRIIVLTAWAIAALNILGLLDEAITLLDHASFSLGQANISALMVFKGAVSLAVLLWGTALLGQVIESRIKASPNLTPSFQVLSGKLLRMVLALGAFLFALSIVGIDLTVFAVLGGAVGVGLGFGLQKIFANLVSGFILLADKSIKPGDVIVVGTDYGTVDSLGARYVSVLTRDGIEHLIPNEELITTRVENWSHSNSLLRLRKMVGVHYKADVRQAIALCMEAMDEVPRILKSPVPSCLLREFADSSVNLEMRFWVNDPMNGRANVTSDLLLLVWDKFHQNDIEIPYPQRDLHLRSSVLNEAFDPDISCDSSVEDPSEH
jgi:small-conductance mechanosensitive channel